MRNNIIINNSRSRLFSQLFAVAFLNCFGVAIITMLMTSSCAEHKPLMNHPASAPSKFGYGGTNSVDDGLLDTEQTSTGSINTDTNAAATTTTSIPPANPSAAPEITNVRAHDLSPNDTPHDLPHDIPYGIPVPGKSGFVTSPHSPNAGYVDVRGFPPATEVKDPYSGKVFLVP